MVRTTDSSLVDEWAGFGSEEVEVGALELEEDVVVRDRRAVTLLVRNALFARVRLAAFEQYDELGALDADWGWRAPRWQRAMEAYFEEHEEVLLDADARSTSYFEIDDSAEKSDHVWHVKQTFHDPEEDRDFGIAADVDLDATQDEGAAVFENYRVGFVEDLLDLA